MLSLRHRYHLPQQQSDYHDDDYGTYIAKFIAKITYEARKVQAIDLRERIV